MKLNGIDKTIIGASVVALTLSLVDAFLYASWYLNFAAICIASLVIGFLIGAWGFRFTVAFLNRQK